MTKRISGAVLGVGVAVYALLIVYGSLFPFSGWRETAAWPLGFLFAGLPKRYSASDLFVNVFAYLPFGLLLFVWFSRVMPQRLAVRLALAGGVLISLTMEAIQTYLPFRVPSLGDLLANAGGTALGVGAAALLGSRSGIGAWIQRWREILVVPGVQAEIAFGAACLGMFVLLSPVLPSLDAAARGASVVPAWLAVVDGSGIALVPVASYAGLALGLMILCARTLCPGLPRFRVVLALVLTVAFIKFCVTVLYLHVPVHRWLLSGRALAGLGLGMIVFRVVLGRGRAVEGWAGVAALALAYFVGEATGETQAETAHAVAVAVGPQAFNWVPFRGQMYGSSGMLDMLASASLFFALGSLVNTITAPPRRRAVLRRGAVAVFALAFAAEWWQRFVPGRHPDLTDALVPLAAWLAAWPWAPLAVKEGAPASASPRRLPALPLVVGPLLLAGAMMIGAARVSSQPVEQPLEREALPRLPSAVELAPVRLPAFRVAHPRLPAPTPAELGVIRERNPAFLDAKRREAKGGEGDLEAAILMAYAEPGSQNLERIFRGLMDLRLRRRGEGAELVALGYDWLYPAWSEVQRQALRRRLAEGFELVYAAVRDERLSPYNVNFYDGPFLRLMALAIVLYRDDPHGEGAMRIAQYVLKSQVLPVWRQVMGKNGGWHEGGEFVGAGIGQAVYRVPAMWRRATGEDLFASESYLRGFADFLAYRKRPDGLDFRWGDAARFDREVPDQYALALEYGDRAAYNLGGAPPPYTPTSRPWGPLADPALTDPKASAALPPARLFDGIGLVVARSGWGEDATYVSFKAGDNYWSHAHLDQGAFTIYKGGALAIDSGLYGPRFDSDHHLDYAAQTIAHNALTVTDPEDTVPLVDKHGNKRQIANDGGQRRVGAAWGVEPVPLDRTEWEAKRELYHTGRIEAYFDDDGLTVAVADVTAAYTNELSGEGSFSHRTRRVERAWRIFAYDRMDDVIVVQDQVVATKAEFHKRWLLHTQEAPAVIGRDFLVQEPASSAPARHGGRLQGRVLLPEDGVIDVVGGPGFEFFADGVNYDGGGRIVKLTGRRNRRDAEPGAWRIELSPGAARKEDEFLVVMLPALLDQRPSHRVTRLSAAGRFGCEIAGPRRTTRWWFVPGRNGVEVEVVEGGASRAFRIGAVATGSAGAVGAPSSE